MIHRRKGRKLKRTASHRKAMLSNLCSSLIMHKKIKTTIAKAKELRRFIEPLVTKSRQALARKSENPSYDIHQRRVVNKFLKDKAAVKTLFDEIAPKVSNRNGGYTRVSKIGRRYGDAAELAYIEFVDYNLESKETKPESKENTKKEKTKTVKTKATTKRTRKSETKATEENAE